MAYTKQTWTAPTGTGLSRYAKSGETETHIELALDPVNLTNTPTPFTMARMAHMEEGIAKAYDTAPPTPWAQYSGKDIPQLPDNVAGRVYFQDAWATTDGWSTAQGIVSVESGKLKFVSNAAVNNITKAVITGLANNQLIVFRILSDKDATIYIRAGAYANIIKTQALKAGVSTLVIGTISNLSTSTSIWISTEVQYTVLFDFIYIGTGAYDRLVFDNSYHYRHLLNNAVIPTPQGLYFNGETSYLRSKEMVPLPDVFTFSATVNCAVKSANQAFLAQNTYAQPTDRILIYRPTNSNELHVIGTDGTTASIFFNMAGYFAGLDNTDIDLKVEIDFVSKTIKAYRNGIQFGSTVSAPTIIKPSSNNIYFGNDALGNNRLLGYMRNIQLYDTVLTDTQRNWLAQGNTPPILYDVTNYETEGYVSIQDADGTNTGVAVSVDSNGNRILKLPSIIKASITGSADAATKLATPRTINEVSFDGSADITVADATKAPIAHASAATTYGVSSEANYGHAKASTVAGSANGTASKGTTPTIFAQSNHVHPLQTSVSGNASTADKWKTARNITISDADGTNTGTAVVVDGSENETLKLPATIKANITGSSGNASKANVRVSLRHGNTWFAETWTGVTNPAGYHIWTDGDNIYHSSGTEQYVLNKSTSTWVTKTWTGLTSFNGDYIWKDGDNIYYSNSTQQYVLNKATSTWVVKTWAGLTDFTGNNIWTDGENIYYSSTTNQYVLNKTTSTWSTKTWSGLTNFKGLDIWTDGENIYYSKDTTQHVLNKSTSTWSTKTWSGLTNFTGNNIWTDGETIYDSSTTQHVLNKSTSTWSTKTWSGLTNFYGNMNWTDGENIYYSSSTTQFVLPATRHNYVDDNKYNPLLGKTIRCNCSTLSDRFVFSNE